MTTPGEPPEAAPPAGYPPAAEWQWAPPPEQVAPEPTRMGRLLATAAGAAAVVAALGVPLGLLWAVLAPDVPLRVVEGGLTFVESQPQQPIAGDGWFAVLAAPFGVLVGVAGYTLRRVRGTAGLLAVVLGAVGAGLVAWWLGRQIGLADYQSVAAAAAPGTVVGRPADLRVAEAGWWPLMITGLPLVPALTAAVSYTMLAAWSRYPTLRPTPAATGTASQPVDIPGA